MSVNSKMTAIADEIRTLSGTTGIMGLDAMATHVGDANDEVGSQTNLIGQIVTALEGKGASGGGADVKTCTVKVIDNLGYGSVNCHVVLYSDGEIFYHKISPLSAGETTINNVVCGSILICEECSNNGIPRSTNATNIGLHGTMYCNAFEIPANSTEIPTITVSG